MAVSAFRGTRLPFLHQSQFPIARNVSGRSKKMIQGRKLKGFVLSAQYSQAQDLFTSRLQSRIENLPKLVEDIVQTSINTSTRCVTPGPSHSGLCRGWRRVA